MRENERPATVHESQQHAHAHEQWRNNVSAKQIHECKLAISLKYIQGVQRTLKC